MVVGAPVQQQLQISTTFACKAANSSGDYVLHLNCERPNVPKPIVLVIPPFAVERWWESAAEAVADHSPTTNQSHIEIKQSMKQPEQAALPSIACHHLKLLKIKGTNV